MEYNNSIFDSYTVRLVIYANRTLLMDCIVSNNRPIKIPINRKRLFVYFILYPKQTYKSFLLTDKNYDGLPIDEGAIILWHSI